jgi:hypothetical protein
VLVLKLRDFELQDNGKIYEKIGIKIVKKIVLSTSGRFLKSLPGNNKPSTYFIGKNISNESILKYAELAKYNETIHFIFGVISIFFVSFDIICLLNGYLEKLPTLVIDLLGLLLNLYLIALQRYNRVRVITAIRKRLYQKDM